MPLEGPISGRLVKGLQSNVETRAADAIKKGIDVGAKKALGNVAGSVLTELALDRDDVKDGVHALVEELFGDFGPKDGGLDPAAAKALGAAAKSFVQPELSAAERRDKLAKAAGDPLTDAVLAVVVDLAELVPAGALSKGAAFVGKSMGDANVKENASTKWYASYIPSVGGVQQMGTSLEALRTRLKQPGFRDELSRALDVVRVLGRLEADNLSKIAIDVDKSQEPAVKQALARFVTSASEGVVLASLPRDSEGGALARDLLKLASIQMRALAGAPEPGDAAAFAGAVKRLGLDDLSGSGVVVDGAAALQETETAARALPDVMNDAEKRLLADLHAAGALTPEATDGVKEMCADFTAVAVTGAHLFRLFGAAKNDKIPDDERISLVKNAAKDAGPVVVKLLQTFANQSGDAGGFDAVTTRALRELQERVPEMSEAEVRSQVETGLGMKLEDAFVSFDLKPLASASIGQAHRAVIKARFGKEREVVVKVQRPNLDVEFARATRVARLGLQFASELVKVLSERGGKKPFGLDGIDVDPTKMMKLVEETVTSFVESFQIETDFDKERVNLKKFRRDMQSHSYVTAPYVYRRWSSKTVMTMEYMRLEKVASLIERATVARDTKKIQAPVGPLPTGDTAKIEADVKKRTVDHIARAFGIVTTPERVTVARDAKTGAWFASASTDHDLFPTIKLSISDIGVIKHVLAPPILKDDDVKLVRDRFLASVLSQAVVHGRVHGDPHKGNWGLLADGKTIVMLDFGKMIDLEKKHLAAPLHLAWAWFRKDPEGMADAALTMSTASTKEKRAQAKKALVDALTALQKEGGQRVEVDQILATVTTTLAAQELGLSSVYTQSIKAGFSFAGNFTGLAEVGAGDITLGSWTRASRIAGGDALDSVTLGVVGSVLALRKNARVASLNHAPKS